MTVVILSPDVSGKNSVTARFVVSFDYAQDDIFRFEATFYETVSFNKIKKS